MNVSDFTPVDGEEIVAVVPAVGDKQEAELSKSVSTIELEAEAITIQSDDDYSRAAEFGRRLKQAASEVTSFFKPMKEAANRAHKEVCSRENTMLNPLKNAEAVLKKTMGNYALLKEQERQSAEREARRIAQEEADRKLAEALKLEESGNGAAAESAMLDAQMADSMSRDIRVDVAPPKATGISQTKAWEIVSIDPVKVPANFQGVELRPVDRAAVARLIKASKGQIQIPGVVYRETVKTSIRK